jgi:hypothetical protein
MCITEALKMTELQKCKICNAVAEHWENALMLGKYSVAYCRCTACGFVSSEEPYWLAEAYATAITGSDVGLIKRNSDLAAIGTVLLRAFFAGSGTFLDFAGGYGLFVRLMRDYGFDFRWYDRYCSNLFANGFAADLNHKGVYSLVTAFEVFEHLVDPVAGLDEILSYSRNILFTTDLLPEPTPKPDQWWYYGLEHGQHVSFYTRKSLEILAAQKGLNFYSNGATVHLLTEKKLSSGLFFLLARRKSAALLAPLLKHRSLLEEDFRISSGNSLH